MRSDGTDFHVVALGMHGADLVDDGIGAGKGGVDDEMASALDRQIAQALGIGFGDGMALAAPPEGALLFEAPDAADVLPLAVGVNDQSVVESSIRAARTTAPFSEPADQP